MEAVNTHEIISDAVLDALLYDQQEECATISVQALSGATHPKTIQFRALIGNQVVLLLLDSGSTHTFVDQALLERTKLPSEQLSEPLSVKVANGDKLQCTEYVPNVTWWLQGQNFTSPMKVLQLGSYDIILGMDWLEKWGVMKCHWAEKWIQFDYNGQAVKLQGVLPSQKPELKEMPVEQLLKWDKGNDIMAVALIHPVYEKEDKQDFPEPIKELLQQYTDVFSDPKSLPPRRQIDHAINLVPGAVPMNSRPYRYSPLQKDEIERQVDEMLKAVIDELAGAKWFSKLDLRDGKKVLSFMDDILVFSKTFEDHLKDLREVLTVLRENQFYVKESKCSFGQQTLEYLGHVISDKGVATDPLKTAAMLDWPVPSNAISTSQPVWIQEVLNSYSVDPVAQDMLQKLALDTKACPGFTLQEGILKNNDKIWIGANVGLQTRLIQAFHSTPVGGHSGILPTYFRVKQLFSWQGMKTDVENFVKQCAICQQAKHELCKYPGLLQPLPIPEGPWQSISMDFIKGLPKSEGYSSILVVVDRFTKVSHFIPLKHPFTAAGVAKAFLQNVVRLHGLPLSIVSDRDKVFTSSFWKELFRVWGTELQMSTTYHPQTDGQTERVALLTKPCMAMSQTLVSWQNTAKSLNPDVSGWILAQTEHTAILKEHLHRAQVKYKHYADKNISPREFMVGEQVYLKLQPYAQSSVVNRPCPKLALKFFGRFKILEKVGFAAYKLELPKGSQVHPIFHVSQLKSHVPDHTPVFTVLPKPLDLSVPGVTPEEILDRRLVKKGNAAHLQVLIKWSNVPVEAATWEDYEVLKVKFPDAPAWGHAGSQGEGNVSEAARKA
ncbi:uncharacterized protein [Aegilops tauschii subsp. strangulata]|uniref:uncharacterized protein n=1 Tax=Aegilops tauschii subsp. strangulata TaxID=200361 RepID=UPI003CC8583F